MKIISMTNMGQIDMMKNMLNSAERVGIPLNLFTVYLMNDIPQASDFWTMNFYNITYRKLKLIYDTLVQLPEGERLFWVDNDIYFFTNPLSELESFEEDFVMQDDIHTGCTGFWTIKRSEKTCNLLKNSLEFMKNNKHERMHDQIAVWETMKRTNHGCSLRLLDRFSYPVGDVYFKPEDYGYTNRSQAKILHNNFLFNAVSKVDRFKQNNLWNPSDEASSKLTIIRLK